MEKRDVMKALLSQLEMSYMTAVEEGVENITLYKETFAKLSALNRRDKTYSDVVNRGLKFAPYGNIKSNLKMDAAISIATKALSSKWASPKGRKEIADKALKTGTRRFGVDADTYQKGVNILSDYKKAVSAVDVLENEIAEDLQSKWMPPSKLVFEAVEMAKSYDMGSQYIQEALDFVEKNASSLNDLDDMRDALYEYFNNLIEEDE